MLSQKQFSQNHGSQKQHKPRQSQHIFYPLPALLLGLFISVSLNFSSLPAQAATVIEEIIVSAQRTDENLQDVPIAVTALTGAMLEDKGIISPSDLQMAAPNVSFTATNFGGSSFSIRGIGRLVIGTTGEAGVSTHVNEIPVATNLNLIEFFDVSRVEVLRGPQGTLFGRNATGGSVNMVTNMPDYDNLSGFFDLEGGDYNNVRAKGALNIPFSDSAGLRLAGFRLQRNGYIENTAYGLVNDAGESLPNIDDDVDGRDILALRATFSWDITENSNFWLQYNYFDEDDDRARLTNQVCKRTAVPALGCEPDESGFDTPHPGSTTAGIFFGLNARGPGGVGSLPLGYEGIPDGAGGIQQDYPQPARNSLREMHTDFEPVYKYEEDLYTLGYEYNFDSFTIGFLGAYQEVEYLSQMDYNMDVGPTFTRPQPPWVLMAVGPPLCPHRAVRGAPLQALSVIILPLPRASSVVASMMMMVLASSLWTSLTTIVITGQWNCGSPLHWTVLLTSRLVSVPTQESSTATTMSRVTGWIQSLWWAPKTWASRPSIRACSMCRVIPMSRPYRQAERRLRKFILI